MSKRKKDWLVMYKYNRESKMLDVFLNVQDGPVLCSVPHAYLSLAGHLAEAADAFIRKNNGKVE